MSQSKKNPLGWKKKYIIIEKRVFKSIEFIKITEKYYSIKIKGGSLFLINIHSQVPFYIQINIK